VTVNEKRMATIQGLMNMANDPALGEEARENYLGKAYELMTKWQIDDAMLAAVKDGKIEPIIKRYIKLTTPTTYSLEYADLIATVAVAMGARGFVSKTYYKDDKFIRAGYYDAIIVGFESDLDTIELLATSLSVQCEMAVAVAARNNPRAAMMTASQKYNFKRSFLVGFKGEVKRRIEKMRKQTVADTTTTGAELVLVDRTAKVDDWVNQEMRIGKAVERKYGSHGYGDGIAAGQKANIGQNELGPKRKAIGG
jgi:hypothetical protein